MLSSCSKSPTAPPPDLYARMYGTWVGVLWDRNSDQNPWMCADSVRLVVEPGTSRPNVRMWQLKLACGLNGEFLRVGEGATWREIEFTELGVVGSTTEGGEIRALTSPDSIGGTVPGRTAGDYVISVGPGDPAGPGAAVSWLGSAYPLGHMTLVLE
jgi:hypothetical protein